MNLLELLVLLVVSGVCGAIGQSIAGFSRGGFLGAIAIGFIGALLGVWLARKLGLPELLSISVGGTAFPILWSIIGSALFVALLGLLNGGRARRRS